MELKYDKVNEYFERFKKKYTNDYESNKIKETRIVRNKTLLINGSVMLLSCLVILIISLYNNPINDNQIKFQQLLTNLILPGMSILASFFILFGVIDFIRGGHEVEIEYTKKEYYNKIKSVMLNELRETLNNKITEDMLIFDKDDLIIKPNLNINEAKKLFGEAERRLKLNE